MPSPIELVEAHILQVVTQVLPTELKETGSLGGNWTMDKLKRALQMSPCVYVAFLGGPANDYKTTRIDARFDVYVVTKAALEPQRRTGSGGSPGAYQLVNVLAPLLHKQQVPEVGTLALKQINNLFKDALLNLGGTVYGLTFAIDVCFDVEAAEVLATHLSFTTGDQTTEVF